MLKKELVKKVEEQEREIKLLSDKLKLKNSIIDNYNSRNIILENENDKLLNKMYQIEQIIENSKGFLLLKSFELKQSIKKILEKK